MAAHDFMAFSVVFHRLGEGVQVHVDAAGLGEATVIAPSEPLAFRMATEVMCAIVANDVFEVPVPDDLSNDLNAMLKEASDERG